MRDGHTNWMPSHCGCWSRRRRCLRSVTLSASEASPPGEELTSIAPWRGARATRYVECWGTLPECNYPLTPIRGYSLRSNLPSGDAFSVISKHYFPVRSTSGFERCARNLDDSNHVSVADAVGATLCRSVAPQGANTRLHKIIAHAIIIDNRATKTMQFITPFRRAGRHKVAPTPFG